MSMNTIKKIKLSAAHNKFVGEDYTVVCGPFVPNAQELAQTDMYTVNLTAEYTHLPSSLSVPIRDYQIPTDLEQWNTGVETVLQKIIQKEKVFFGCFGGIGRTGIMLGCLAKVFGVENANIVYFTRTNLHPHALETQEQIDFVKDFNPKLLKGKLDYFYLENLYKENKEGANSQSIDFLSPAKLEQKTAHFINRYKANPFILEKVCELLLDYKKTAAIQGLIAQQLLPLNLVVYKKELGNLNWLDLAYQSQNKELIQFFTQKELKPIQEKYQHLVENKHGLLLGKFLALTQLFRPSHNVAPHSVSKEENKAPPVQGGKRHV